MKIKFYPRNVNIFRNDMNLLFDYIIFNSEKSMNIFFENYFNYDKSPKLELKDGYVIFGLNVGNYEYV